MSVCCDGVNLGEVQGGKRKQLFVSANRSVSDRNTQGAALRKIFLPINQRVPFLKKIVMHAARAG